MIYAGDEYLSADDDAFGPFEIQGDWSEYGDVCDHGATYCPACGLV